MKRTSKILLGTLAALILAGGVGGYIAYNKASDLVIQKVMENMMEKQLDEYLETLDLDAIVAAQVEKGPQTESVQTEPLIEEPKNAEQTTTPQEQTQQPAGETKEDRPSKGGSGTTSKEEIKQAAKVDIQSQAQAIVSQIPSKDKNSMMGLILGNISSSDMSYLVSLVMDGNISGADIAKAKEVALRSFDEAQLEQVKYYYNKYAALVLK